MFGVSNTLIKLATALVEGDDSLLVKLLTDKVEQLGRDLISDVIGATAFGAGLSATRRFGRAVETGGASELNRLRDQWLNTVRPARLPGLRGLQKVLDYQNRPRRTFKWQRGGWARSRQEWLDEGWRHDWRSQPRDLRGRWIPGRLDYPLQTKLRVSRRLRRLRRVRNANRRVGRAMARGIVSSWGQDGG